MQVYQLVKPFGIVTYAFILFTVLTGLRIIKIPVKSHKLVGLIALILGTLHACLVIYVTYF
jgi:hypothetical protein